MNYFKLVNEQQPAILRHQRSLDFHWRHPSLLEQGARNQSGSQGNGQDQAEVPKQRSLGVRQEKVCVEADLRAHSRIRGGVRS